MVYAPTGDQPPTTSTPCWCPPDNGSGSPHADARPWRADHPHAVATSRASLVVLAAAVREQRDQRSSGGLRVRSGFARRSGRRRNGKTAEANSDPGRSSHCGERAVDLNASREISAPTRFHELAIVAGTSTRKIEQDFPTPIPKSFFVRSSRVLLSKTWTVGANRPPQRHILGVPIPFRSQSHDGDQPERVKSRPRRLHPARAAGYACFTDGLPAEPMLSMHSDPEFQALAGVLC